MCYVPFDEVPDGSVCVFPKMPDANRLGVKYRKRGCFAIVLDAEGNETSVWIRWHDQKIETSIAKEDNPTSARS